MENLIQNIFENWHKTEGKGFSGVFSASGPGGIIYQQACGYRNRAEELPNTTATAFGIASGTKLFTGLAICKLIDEKSCPWKISYGIYCPMTWGKLIRG